MKTLPGFYRATVVGVNDPADRGRVRLLIPSLFGTQPTGWAEPMMELRPPAVGAVVWAAFEAGSPDHPLYLSRWAEVHPHGDDIHTITHTHV